MFHFLKQMLLITVLGPFWENLFPSKVCLPDLGIKPLDSEFDLEGVGHVPLQL
jgi:hypothetical protein